MITNFSKTIFLFVLSLLICCQSIADTFLPPGEQVFLDNNGNPLASGKVYFYIPNTTTPKNTYQDTNQSVTNTNPVILNAAGRAIIFGHGAYRQILKDSSDNVIWDRYTSDAASTTVSWGGTSTGSANAQSVTGHNFSDVTGQAISFIAGYTNTGGFTLNPGSGPINVLKNTITGPIGLTGGEIVVGNQYTVMYDGSIAQFFLSSFPQQFVGASSNLASATTTNLGSIPSHNVNITGTTTIASFGSSASTSNPFYIVSFSGALTLTQSASILTPDGKDLITTASSTAIMLYKGSGVWQVLNYSAGAVPKGMVAMFNLASCPTGWTYADGTGVTADLRGRFPRGFDNGAGIFQGNAVGSLFADQLQDHQHQFNAIILGGAGYYAGGAGTLNPNTFSTTNPISGNHGAETRPYTTVLMPCQKQ